MILLIINVKTFKTDIIFFYWQHHNVMDVILTNNFQYQSQFTDTDNITQQRSKVKSPGRDDTPWCDV